MKWADSTTAVDMKRFARRLAIALLVLVGTGAGSIAIGQATQPSADEATERANSTTSFIHNGVTVYVTCFFGQPSFMGEDGWGVDADVRFHVYFGIVNKNETRKLRYETWRTNASVKDEHGNVYGHVKYAKRKLDGSINSAALYPNELVKDVAAYEKPINAAKKLIVTLPMRNIFPDDKSDKVLEIPVSAVKVKPRWGSS